MLRSIRQWHKHIREIGWGPNVFPPKVMPTFERRSFEEYLLSTFANLDVNRLLRVPNHLDKLEVDLVKELNRTHEDNFAMQTGQVESKRKGCWEIELSEQPGKLSWRRSGRKRKEEQKDGEQVDG